MQTLISFYHIGYSTIKEVIKEVCNILNEMLIPLCLRFPTVQEFRNIAHGFLNQLHFPHCI